MSPKGQPRRTGRLKLTRAPKRAGPRPPVYYRYVSSGEAAVIRVTHHVPNVDLAGRPKRVYLTTSLFKSAARAEVALKIGAHHPVSPFPSPTDRVRINLTGIAPPTYVGIVVGGTAPEYYTVDSPLVRYITSLRP